MVINDHCHGSGAEWLQQVSQGHEMYCHDLEVMSSNPGWVELGVHSTSVPSRTGTKYIFQTRIMRVLFSYTLLPARFPRIKGASGNGSEHHTSRSNWLISRTLLGF